MTSHHPEHRRLGRVLRSAEMPVAVAPTPLGRRAFLAGAAAFALAGPGRAAVQKGTSKDVAIVGAGLAGLVCAERLLAGGTVATLYEASDRVGGRQFSMPNFHKGIGIERGGELIDTAHKTMIGYANRFGLPLESYRTNPGEEFFHFFGRSWTESEVVVAFRAFVPAMKADVRDLSGATTAFQSTAFDRQIDALNLSQYLVSRGASPLIRAVIEEAYVAEYGREPSEQSALGFLYFMRANNQSTFEPFGVSDERYHVVEGNDRIAAGIAAGLARAPRFGHRLVRVRKLADGRIELTFQSGTSTVVRVHDTVVLAIPFSVLRTVDLDASLGLPAGKVKAIRELGYGTNAKMMVAFEGRPWNVLGSNGASYADLPNYQATWETNHTKAGADRGVLVDYSGGIRGAALNPARTSDEAEKWLRDAEVVYPGSAAAATRSKGRPVAHLEHWPSNPLTRGSYTCYLPGQFSTIAGWESVPVGNLHFAGEHANSFYEWQGFMEGACLSGIQTAAGILA
ncbi:MAG: flavin monoamine oxidase family protein [Armatimonadota bacterium]